jgi:NAD(P)-dependent dehydrogenase (short-subunit alcohol dehydrogenase family)
MAKNDDSMSTVLAMVDDHRVRHAIQFSPARAGRKSTSRTEEGPMKHDSVALVTGCSSGFGRLLIEPLARAGHVVFAAMRDSRGRNSKAAEDLEALAKRNLHVHVLDMDVTSTQSVNDAVGAVLKHKSRIDVVVNNAGIAPIGVTEAYSIAQVQATLETNFTGVFRVNQAVLPTMRKQNSGLLLHISSINGRIAVPFYGVYSASKFAVEALAEILRYELASFGVDSCIVEPGPFPTEAWKNSPPPADAARLDAYGLLARGRDQILATAGGLCADKNNPVDPKLFVDAVLKLIATPAGERPLRTVVGIDFGAVKLNELTAPFAKGVLEALGMTHLENVKAATRAHGT